MTTILREPPTADENGDARSVAAPGGTSQGRPRPTGNSGFAALIAGSCSIAAGAIHIGASQTHLEHVTLTRLMLAEGTVQLIAGIALVVTVSRLAVMAVAAVNTVAVGSWLVTRFVGISWIPGLEEAEAPQGADTITAALAAFAVVALALGARSGAAGSGPVRPPRALTGGVVVGITALALFGLNSVGSHDHGAEAAVSDTAWQIGASEAEVEDTEKLVAETQEVVATFTSVADAESKGFVRINGDHLLNVDRVFDDKQLDPTAIESLVVGQRDGEDYIRGGMYLLDLEQSMRDVPRFGGPLMVWHSHGGFCFEANGVIAAGPEAGGDCAEGSIWLDDPPMVHIYNEPQADEGVVRTTGACGTFTYMDLPFEGPVPGCVETANDGHEGHEHT